MGGGGEAGCGGTRGRRKLLLQANYREIHYRSNSTASWLSCRLCPPPSAQYICCCCWCAQCCQTFETEARLTCRGMQLVAPSKVTFVAFCLISGLFENQVRMKTLNQRYKKASELQPALGMCSVHCALIPNGILFSLHNILYLTIYNDQAPLGGIVSSGQALIGPAVGYSETHQKHPYGKQPANQHIACLCCLYTSSELCWEWTQAPKIFFSISAGWQRAGPNDDRSVTSVCVCVWMKCPWVPHFDLVPFYPPAWQFGQNNNTAAAPPRKITGCSRGIGERERERERSWALFFILAASPWGEAGRCQLMQRTAGARLAFSCGMNALAWWFSEFPWRAARVVTRTNQKVDRGRFVNGCSLCGHSIMVAALYIYKVWQFGQHMHPWTVDKLSVSAGKPVETVAFGNRSA